MDERIDDGDVPTSETAATADPGPDAAAADEELGQVAHDAGVPRKLLAFMTSDWADTTVGDVQPEAAAPHRARRRAQLSERFRGEALVIPSGRAKVRSNDTDHRFRPGSDFFWLCGSPDPDGVLVLAPQGDGHEATAYVHPRSDRSTPAFFTDRAYGELWVGPRRGLAESEAVLGVRCRPLAELPSVLAGLGDTPVRLLRGFDPHVDVALGRPGPQPVGAPRPTDEDDPQRAADSELAAALAEMKLVKDDHEVARIQDAVDATIRGFEDVVRALPEAVGTSERWVEGVFNLRARVDGNDVGYETIAASGHHATILHWVRNDGVVRPGDLLLLDAGIEVDELYTADVTRTLPISGRFSAVQREVYELVLEAQEAALAAVKPKAAFLDPHRAAMKVLAAGLIELGVLRCSLDEALDPEASLYRRYTLHGTSHMLGIDVHDCARARDEHYRSGDLDVGYVLTVEPGLYFQRDDLTVPEHLRGIGVRIEDDVLVTKDGGRNLSAALPRRADDVEAWMADLLGDRLASLQG